MRNAVLQIIGCMLLLHLFSYEAKAQETIAEIVVTGNRFVSEEKIRRIVRLKAGDSYDVQSVTEALKRLYATKEVADVRAYRQVQGSLVTLTIEVKEYQRIDEVRFDGNKKVDDKDLVAKIALKKGAFVRPAVLRKDHHAIEELYKEKGYYRVAVTDAIKVEEEKKSKRKITVLVYQIAEGEKISIKHIDFFGNRSLESDDLRGSMESKEDTWFRGGEFKPKVLEEDQQKIVDLYRQHGFLDAQVADQELIFSEDGKGLDVFLTVDEGQRYKVGKVTWSGNTLFSDSEIRPMVVLRQGAVFNDKLFQDVQLAISLKYSDRGYIFNSISPEKTIKEDIVDVVFGITEGNPARIREINITGNTKTAERVIRRELVVNPGDVFLRPRLLRSLREVFNLGFFAGPPEIGTNVVNDGDIDLTLKVEEKQTGQFRLGAGFSALNSISGFIGFAETNFLGKGQQVSIDWEFSRFRQNVDLRFTEPWLMGTPTQLSVNLFNRVQNQVRQQFYDDKRTGASLSIGRPFPWFDYTSIFWRYRFESIELSDFSPTYDGPLLDVRWPQATSSTALTLVRNSTDSPFRPSEGTRSSILAELNGGPLGGDVKFHRYEANFSWYEKLFWRFILEARFNVGVMNGYGGGAVPDYERYRLGGNRRLGVRGYDFFEIFPEGNPEFLGGRYMQRLSYEITLPLAPNVYTLAFFDGGNTWNSFRGAELFNLKKGLGLGIRLELPMLGTVGFDYGYGFDKPAGAGWEPHISLGAGF